MQYAKQLKASSKPAAYAAALLGGWILELQGIDVPAHIIVAGSIVIAEATEATRRLLDRLVDQAKEG